VRVRVGVLLLLLLVRTWFRRLLIRVGERSVWGARHGGGGSVGEDCGASG
jgi:hypothetical protein